MKIPDQRSGSGQFSTGSFQLYSDSVNYTLNVQEEVLQQGKGELGKVEKLAKEFLQVNF